MKFAHV